MGVCFWPSHTRKNATAGAAAGQGLRGSSDIHAFGDSNLYLRRAKEHLVLSSEHRAAPPAPPVLLQLVGGDAQTTHLEVVAELTYLMILDEGREKGAREDILLVGEERFGPPDEAIKAQLNVVTDLDRLKRMVRRTAKAASWQEIVDTP